MQLDNLPFFLCSGATLPAKIEPGSGPSEKLTVGAWGAKPGANQTTTLC